MDDGQRFRFWCWMIQHNPSLLAIKIANCIEVDEYRAVLDELMLSMQFSETLH